MTFFNALINFLVANFNSLTINSTNLDSHIDFAVYQITAKNDDNQIVTIDISRDDDLFNFTVSYIDHLEITECTNMLSLIEAVRDFVENDDFIKPI